MLARGAAGLRSAWPSAAAQPPAAIPPSHCLCTPLAPPLQRYVKARGEDPDIKAIVQGGTGASTSASGGGDTPTQQPERRGAEGRQDEPQHVLPVVEHSLENPNLFLQPQRRPSSSAVSSLAQQLGGTHLAGQAGGGGDAAAWPGVAVGQATVAWLSRSKPAGAAAGRKAGSAGAGGNSTPGSGRKRPRASRSSASASDTTAMATAAAAFAHVPSRAAGGGSGGERLGSGSGGSTGTKIRLSLPPSGRAKQQRRQQVEGSDEWAADEGQPPSRRRRRRPPQQAQQAQPGPGMVLLSQLHSGGGGAAGYSSSAATGPQMRFAQPELTPEQQQQAMQAMAALEQTPGCPMLSPLAICLLAQGSGTPGSLLASGGLAQLLGLPSDGANEQGTPPGAGLLPLELEELIAGGEFTIESLLGSLPPSPATGTGVGTTTPLPRLTAGTGRSPWPGPRASGSAAGGEIEACTAAAAAVACRTPDATTPVGPADAGSVSKRARQWAAGRPHLPAFSPLAAAGGLLSPGQCLLSPGTLACWLK